MADLRELAEMYKNGILTAAEFEASKKQLLGESVDASPPPRADSLARPTPADDIGCEPSPMGADGPTRSKGNWSEFMSRNPYFARGHAAKGTVHAVKLLDDTIEYTLCQKSRPEHDWFRDQDSATSTDIHKSEVEPHFY
jgi:hypothetical protein